VRLDERHAGRERAPPVRSGQATAGVCNPAARARQATPEGRPTKMRAPWGLRILIFGALGAARVGWLYLTAGRWSAELGEGRACDPRDFRAAAQHDLLVADSLRGAVGTV